jgi:integrase
VSDLKRIKPENINRNTQVIKLTQIKTKELVTIPIPRKCIEILENWNYEIPNIHDQKYNKYLKIVAKKAGIDELFEAVRYSGINRIVNTKPKYEFISTHTARRTGITLLIRRGVPLNMIMKISGQKRIETIMRYVKLTQDEAVESVRLAWG